MILKTSSKIIISFVWCLLVCLLKSKTFAQSSANGTIQLIIPEIAILDLEPNTTLALQFIAPSEAGNPITFNTTNATWLNYTSCLAQGDVNRTISVQVNQNISGIEVQLQANASTGGGGVLGSNITPITLATVSKNVITGIGGAYTGNGSGNGHRLSYTLNITDYQALRKISNTPILVTYTISD